MVYFRVQAVAIGQALIDADYLDPIQNITTPFKDDFTLYRPNEVRNISSLMYSYRHDVTKVGNFYNGVLWGKSLSFVGSSLNSGYIKNVDTHHESFS